MSPYEVTLADYEPRPGRERTYRTKRTWLAWETRRPLDVVLAHGACSFTEWHDAERYLEAEIAA